MAEPTIVHSSFVIEQTYATPPARLFAALSDPESKRRWYHHGENHTVGDYRMEFRVGGVEEWEATFNSGSPFPGARLASRGIILDIVPDARIVLAADMSLARQEGVSAHHTGCSVLVRDARLTVLSERRWRPVEHLATGLRRR